MSINTDFSHRQISSFSEFAINTPNNPLTNQPATMARFFVVAIFVAIYMHQKLSLAATYPGESSHHSGHVKIKFGGDHHKKYSTGAELAHLAQSAAQQARTAVRNQQTAGLQATLTTQIGLARAATNAAAATNVALRAKQVIVQNLQGEAEDAQRRLQEEQSQYQQAQAAAAAAVQAVGQSQRNIGPATALLAAVQQTLSQSERSAATFGALAANQQQMVQEAEQQLARVHARLEAAQAELHATEEAARRAAQAAKAARSNAAASAQLAAVSTVALDGGIEENKLHH